VYGLAESTLMVSGPKQQAEFFCLDLDKASLGEGRVRPVEASAIPERRGQRLVGCGHVIPEHRVVIANPETRTRARLG
jgi:hypothetical protein